MDGSFGETKPASAKRLAELERSLVAGTLWGTSSRHSTEDKLPVRERESYAQPRHDPKNNHRTVCRAIDQPWGGQHLHRVVPLVSRIIWSAYIHPTMRQASRRTCGVSRLQRFRGCGGTDSRLRGAAGVAELRAAGRSSGGVVPARRAERASDCGAVGRLAACRKQAPEAHLGGVATRAGGRKRGEIAIRREGWGYNFWQG